MHREIWEREDYWVEWKEFLWSHRLNSTLIDTHWWLVKFELGMKLVWQWPMVANVWRFDVDFVFEEDMTRDEVIFREIFNHNRSIEIEVMKWHHEVNWETIPFHLNSDHYIDLLTINCELEWIEWFVGGGDDKVPMNLNARHSVAERSGEMLTWSNY